MGNGNKQFDLNGKQALVIRCAGNLDVRGDVGATVRFKHSGEATISSDEMGGRIDCQGNMRVQMPAGASLVLEEVGGNVNVKGVRAVSAEADFPGNVNINVIDQAVTIGTVNGNASLKQIGGMVTINGEVNGDLGIKHVGGISADGVNGDFAARHIAGDVTVHNVNGDCATRHISGNLTLSDVHADVVAGHIGGTVIINSHDDVKLRGPLAVGKHAIDSQSTIAFYYPADEPLTIHASASRIINRMQFEQISETQDALAASRGEGGAVVTLNASDKIVLRDRGGESDYEGQVDIDLDFGDFGEKLANEINSRMSEFSARFDTEFSGQAERALRKAQAAVDRAIGKMEREMQKAERRAERKVVIRTAAKARSPKPPKPPKPPKGPVPPMPPTPPTPPPAVDTSSEQLKILKMLEEGIISIEEANSLLAALG